MFGRCGASAALAGVNRSGQSTLGRRLSHHDLAFAEAAGLLSRSRGSPGSRASRCRPPAALVGSTRSFCAASEGEDDGRPKRRKPIDVTTRLDVHRAHRRVERRIEEHVKSAAADPDPDPAVEPSERPNLEANALADTDAPSELALPAQQAIRIHDPNTPLAGEADVEKDVMVRSRTTTGQVLWPATKEDIAILSESELLYPAPYEVEGSVIIRLVRLSDPVTSPVGRTVRNRQFGIRGTEKWQLLAMGVVSCMGIYLLGIWQLQRMEWKRNLIEMRRTRLAMPRICVNSGPFPWRDQVQDYVYRVVEVRGVFDHKREMHIGPRPGTGDGGETSAGYLVITPLRLEDGSTILVNRGHVDMEHIDLEERPEPPVWVKLRGVLEEGEIPNLVGQYARLKNRPDKNMFMYLIAGDLAENSGARNHQECSQALLTAFDTLYEDDFKAGVRRKLPFSMRHKEDYLLFWADEHTHFNYAMQWFGMGTLILTMTVYKFIEVSRWRF